MSDIDYSIPAIPTMYNGRQYRSRLEARWAAFFDLLGWEFEYEPCDLGTWSPDFALRCRIGYSILVEVKPIKEWHRQTARKMADTMSRVLAKGDAGKISPQILLLGDGPATPSYEGTIFDYLTLGWIGLTDANYEAEWIDAQVAQLANGEFDFVPAQGTTILYPGPLLGSPTSDFETGGECVKRVKGLWVEAANKVQWHPKAKRARR